MARVRIGAVVAVLALAGAARAEVEVDRFAGEARRQGGALLYREEHVVRRSGDRLLGATTTYRDAEGRPLAVLRTDFSADPYAPSYVFEDLRSGAVEEVSPGEGRVALRAGPRSRTVPAPEGEARRLVAGQGLDRYVRARLDEILAGARLDVAYPIPSRLETHDLRVRALGRPDGATVWIRAEFSSWVLRLLAPSLDVEYDLATRRLVRYRGPSNLAFDGGENPLVEITYAYPGEDRGDLEARRGTE